MTKTEIYAEAVKARKVAFANISKEPENKEYQEALENALNKEYEAKSELLFEERALPKVAEKEEKKEQKNERTLTLNGRVLSSESVHFVERLCSAIRSKATFSELVPREVSDLITMKRQELARIRNIASVHVATGDYSFAVEGGKLNAFIVGEGVAFTEQSASLKSISLGAFKLGALVKVSKEMVADVVPSVIEYIVSQIATAFAEKEDDLFLNGAGTTEPTGIITAVKADGEHKGDITQATSGAITFDEVKKLIDGLGKYADHGTLVMNRSTASAISMLKDGNKYIFDSNQPLTQVYGCKVVITDKLANLGDKDGVAIVAGDFSYYHIADRLTQNIETLTELYAKNWQIGVLGVERIDGNVALTDAFTLYKTASK